MFSQKKSQNVCDNFRGESDAENFLLPSYLNSNFEDIENSFNIHTDTNNLNQVVCGCGIGCAAGKIKWIRIIRSFE